MGLNRSEYVMSTWILDRFALVDALNMIGRYGFDSVEIWADLVHLDPRLCVDVRQVEATLKQNGQTVHSIHAPFRSAPFDHPTQEAEFRAYRMGLWRQTIELCERLGASIMVVHAVDRGEYNYPLAQAHVVRDCLAELVAYGAPRGVSIALENIAPSRVPDPLEIACTLADQSKLFGGIGLKYCLDIGHAPLNGADPYREIDAVARDLASFHISNNDGKNDLHTLPYDGVLDWDRIRDHARSAGYTGEFVLEICGGNDQEQTLSRAAALFD